MQIEVPGVSASRAEAAWVTGAHGTRRCARVDRKGCRGMAARHPPPQVSASRPMQQAEKNK